MLIYRMNSAKVFKILSFVVREDSILVQYFRKDIHYTTVKLWDCKYSCVKCSIRNA